MKTDDRIGEIARILGDAILRRLLRQLRRPRVNREAAETRLDSRAACSGHANETSQHGESA